jgi:hypothetical protein
VPTQKTKLGRSERGYCYTPESCRLRRSWRAVSEQKASPSDASSLPVTIQGSSPLLTEYFAPGNSVTLTDLPRFGGVFLSATDERYKVNTDGVPYMRWVRLPSAIW